MFRRLGIPWRKLINYKLDIHSHVVSSCELETQTNIISKGCYIAAAYYGPHKECSRNAQDVNKNKKSFLHSFTTLLKISHFIIFLAPPKAKKKSIHQYLVIYTPLELYTHNEIVICQGATRSPSSFL